MTTPDRGTPRSALRLALAAAVVPLAVVLTACGGNDPGTPEVASVPTPTGHSSGAAGGAPGDSSADTSSPGHTAGRPIIRLDDNEDRRFALWTTYSKCLLKHGAKEEDNGMGIGTGGGDRPTQRGILLKQPIPAAAEAACLSIEPMGPLELDAATNPDFHEQSLAYVACLREHGEWVRLLNDHDIDWTYLEGHSVPDDTAKFEQQCLLDAFGGQ